MKSALSKADTEAEQIVERMCSVRNAGYDHVVALQGEAKRLIDWKEYARAKPILTTLPGFSEGIGGARKLSDLPAAARNYIDFIQKYTGVPASIVSVGPDREQTMMV